MDEIPRYRKKKPQVSKSSKRSGHKHDYERTLTARLGADNQIADWHWSTHCKICGRLGEFYIDNDDLRKEEYRGKRLWYYTQMFLSSREILTRYPDIPVYINSIDNPWSYRKMTKEERDKFMKCGGQQCFI